LRRAEQPHPHRYWFFSGRAAKNIGIEFFAIATPSMAIW
jgi:hypothetical protein